MMAGADAALFERLARLQEGEVEPLELEEADGEGEGEGDALLRRLLGEAARLAAAPPPARRWARQIASARKIDSKTISESSDKSVINKEMTDADNNVVLKLIGNGNDEPIISPRLKNNNTYNRKLNNALEELKNFSERLKSLQIQYSALVETNNNTKSLLNKNMKDKQTLALQLLEKDDCISTLQKDVEFLKSQNSQMSFTKSKLSEEMFRTREDKKNMSCQLNKDKITIQDLQRQCKEMENILIKRHPDSVSALIVASKQKSLEGDTKTLLERRISDLENELKNQDEDYQSKLLAIQEKVTSMKENYETHISDLETQVLNLQVINTELKDKTKSKDSKEFSLQTDCNTVSVGIQTLPFRPLSARSKSQTMVTSTTSFNAGQVKENTHLVATLRGLNLEISQKDKNILKLNKELEESKKSIVKLQKSKDPTPKIFTEKSYTRKQPAKTTISKIVKSNSDILHVNSTTNKDNNAKHEDDLKSELNHLQEDYENLKKKRIDDLVELQTTHEKELMNLNMKVFPLQKNVDTLNSTVETLQSQIKAMDDQLSIIVTERDHFKCRAEQLDFKLGQTNGFDSDRSLKNISRSGDRDYDVLKMKVMQLEKRYEGREVRLKTLINSLAKLKDVHTGISSIDSITYPDSSVTSIKRKT